MKKINNTELIVGGTSAFCQTTAAADIAVSAATIAAYYGLIAFSITPWGIAGLATLTAYCAFA